MSCYECWTSTINEKACFKFKWNVHRSVVDKLFMDEAENTKSASFETKFYETSWYMQLGQNKASPNDLSLFVYLDRCSLNFSEIYACCKFTLIDHEASAECTDYESEFIKYHNDMAKGRGFKSWIDKNDLFESKYWKDDFITIEAKLQVKIQGSEVVTNDKPLTPVVVDNSVEEKYGRLLTTGVFSDVTLCVGEKKFKTHRCILSVACEYFNAMFQGSFKESSESEIQITEIEPEVFEVILNYIYTSQLSSDLGPLTKDVLSAAHVYGLQSVVESCEDQLCKDINMSNCVELLSFADLYNQNKLRDVIVSFLRQNLLDVVESEDWKELKKTNVKLALDAFEAAVLKI